MSKFGFIGPTYTSQSKAADGERCINLYPEVTEGSGKSPMFLARRPGLRLLVPLPDKPVRTLFSGDGQNIFCVSGSTLFEITVRNPPPNQLGAGLRQALITASGGNADTFPLSVFTATQWGGWYGTVTGHAVPDPSTYGFKAAGDGKWYGAAATVTVDQWMQAFFAANSYVTVGLAGQIPMGTSPAKIYSNRNSLFITSSGQGLLANAGAIAGQVPALMGGFVDGYLLALQPDGLSVQFSGLYDGSTWNGLSFFSPTGAPDAVLSILTVNREVWNFKQQSTEIYDDVGDPNFVFLRSGGGYIEQGIVAPFSAVRLDNTTFWLGGDERGAGIVWRATGYTPTRVSNHAFESAVQGYPQINDAEAFPLQMGGHSFYVIHFPSAHRGAGATWVYDCAASAMVGKAQWTEWLSWDPVHGQWSMFRARCHAYARMTHFAGDWLTGNVYALDPTVGTDNGGPLRWLRSSPHIGDPSSPTFHSNFWVDMQTGVGLNDNLVETNQQPYPEVSIPLTALTAAAVNTAVAAGNATTQLGVAGKAPLVVLRMSNDGGQTWGNEHQRSPGMIGKFKGRVRLAGSLGQAFDRCYEISGSDPVPTFLIEAGVDTERGL